MKRPRAALLGIILLVAAACGGNGPGATAPIGLDHVAGEGASPSELAQETAPPSAALQPPPPPGTDPAIVAAFQVSHGAVDVAVKSVTETTYGQAMCGLHSYRLPYDQSPVAIVVLEGTWDYSGRSVPYGTTPTGPASYTGTRAVIVDRATSVSLQTFQPWPLQRDPSSGCVNGSEEAS